MFRKSIWVFILLSLLLSSCSLSTILEEGINLDDYISNLFDNGNWEDYENDDDYENNDSSPIEEPAPVIQEPAEPITIPPSDLSKWSLWTHGTQLRGANTWQRIIVPRYDGEDFLGSGYIGPQYTQSDFDKLAALGANYVNLSSHGIFTERPPYVLDQQALENLDHMISMATEADLFVVITFRTGPGRNDFTFYRDDNWFKKKDLIESVWEEADAQDAWSEMWQVTADRYRDNPVVIGYDLMCEPNSNEIIDVWEPDEFQDEYGGSLWDWNAWYPDIVNAIREVDQVTPILVGGNAYSMIEWLPYLDTVNADRMVYVFHQYEPFSYTHMDPDEDYSYPGQMGSGRKNKKTFDYAWLYHLISLAEDFATEHDAIVAVNEYGAARWGNDSASFMNDQMTIFEHFGLNYALWIWDPVWQPWNDEVNSMNFRYGPDPDNTTEIPNELQNTIMEFWARNTVRPSDFYLEKQNP